ncbi:MAG: ribosome biogenesis protein [Thaumarchaeota archaeon]|nr:ribosome biogenesis protein [Nitrososphaerota archaeon]
MLSLVLAESSLEIIPQNLQKHPSILSHAKRQQKKPSEMLLDNSWHFAAMKGIKDEIKRGRPDLVHVSVLAATDTPLYEMGQVGVHLHTTNNHTITFGRNVRIPKSYHRFAGLVEKLFRDGTVQGAENQLLNLDRETFPEMINRLGPSQVVGLSTEGKPASFEKVSSILDEKSCIVVGAFQKGHFSSQVQNKIDCLYSVGNISYDAHVVISRILYEYEKRHC